jgi:hypothetical protein
MSIPLLQPATPDDLAAIYLRARDTPCPNCHYNRRDGLAAACPECAHPLTFRPGTMTEAASQIAALRWIARLLLIAQAVDIAARLGFGIWTATLMFPLGTSTLTFFIVQNVLHLSAAIVALVAARKVLAATRPQAPDTARALRHLKVAAAATVAMIFLSPIFSLAFRLF